MRRYLQGAHRLAQTGNPFGRSNAPFQSDEQQSVEDLAKEMYAAWEKQMKEEKEQREALAKKKKEESAAAIKSHQEGVEAQKAISAQTKTLMQKIKDVTMGIASAVNEAKKQMTAKDSGKMSMGELARMNIFQPGTSVEAADQGALARELLDLRKKADEARKAGRLEGVFGDSFAEYNQKAMGIEEKLLEGGYARRSELSQEALQKAAGLDPTVTKLETELITANDTLKEIEKATKAERAYSE